ncbi:MAG: hypothetical protein HYZ12_05875, partial [Thaumarchaeota archaeon]|nr:hypothetical protein [Nitrososphaerota archaeon]
FRRRRARRYWKGCSIRRSKDGEDDRRRLCRLLTELEDIQTRRTLQSFERAPDEFINEVDALESIIDLRKKIC